MDTSLVVVEDNKVVVRTEVALRRVAEMDSLSVVVVVLLQTVDCQTVDCRMVGFQMIDSHKAVAVNLVVVVT